MSLDRELAALRSLARRLSEPWPAEERLARWLASGLASRSLGRIRSFPHTVERHTSSGRVYETIQAIPSRVHDDDFTEHVLNADGIRVTLHDHDPGPAGTAWTPVAEIRPIRVGPSGNPAGRARRGHRFRYADGRVEWRQGVDPMRATWDVLVQPNPSMRPGRLMFRRRVFAEPGRPDVIEYHEDDPSAAVRLEAAALAELREERRMAERPLSAEGRATIDRLRAQYLGGRAQRLEVRQQSAAETSFVSSRSWMPSIAGVGPVVLRWCETTETTPVEEWRTFEAIRKGVAIYLAYGEPRASHWLMTVPVAHRVEAERALEETRDEFLGLDVGETVLDVFARAVADRLTPQPRHLPAQATRRLVRGVGRRPDGKRIRARYRSGLDLPTLGTLAARYTPRRPDGSFNRHDVRRWMRAFAVEALVAGDALQEGDRLRAIEALCNVVGVDDAVRLTERPGAATVEGCEQIDGLAYDEIRGQPVNRRGSIPPEPRTLAERIAGEQLRQAVGHRVDVGAVMDRLRSAVADAALGGPPTRTIRFDSLPHSGDFQTDADGNLVATVPVPADVARQMLEGVHDEFLIGWSPIERVPLDDAVRALPDQGYDAQYNQVQIPRRDDDVDPSPAWRRIVNRQVAREVVEVVPSPYAHLPAERTEDIVARARLRGAMNRAARGDRMPRLTDEPVEIGSTVDYGALSPRIDALHVDADVVFTSSAVVEEMRERERRYSQTLDRSSVARAIVDALVDEVTAPASDSPDRP